MSVKLLFITPDYAKTIEFAARTSTATECRENSEEFVRKLVKKGHLSIGRHCNASFEIICSRACSHQLVRHTHLAYTQESQRYVTFNTEKFQGSFVKPHSIYKNITVNEFGSTWHFYEDCIDEIYQMYDQLLERGIPKEDARYILPNACKTRLVVSGNFQAIADFCCLRNQKEAQWEIQEIAREIFEIMAKEAPAYFEYFRGKDGYCKRKEWD